MEPYSFTSFHLGLAAIVVLVLSQVILTLIAAAQNPAEARQPRDERERLIEARSHTLGYYAMTVGMIAVVVATHMPHTSFMTTVFLGVGVLAIATIIVALAQIVMFRRGA